MEQNLFTHGRLITKIISEFNGIDNSVVHRFFSMIQADFHAIIFRHLLRLTVVATFFF